MVQLILLVILVVVVLAMIWIPPTPSSQPAPASRRPPEASRREAVTGPRRVPSRRVVTISAAIAAIAAVTGLALSRDEAEARPLVVVIPFESIGDQESYVAAGFTDELTTRLATLSGLRVGSRSLIAAAQRAGDSFQGLDVDYLLEGSVSVNGAGADARLRVRARLVEADALTQVWAEVFDEPVERVFDVGGQVTRGVAAAMGVAVVGEENSAITRPRTESFDAYQVYLEGIAFRRGLRARANAFAALEAFRRATALDPAFASAWGARGGTHAWLAHWHGFEGHADSARTLVAHAARMDPMDLDVRMAQAMVAWSLDHELERALALYQEIEETVDPLRAPIARNDVAMLLARLGRWPEAMAVQRRAIAEDPVLSPVISQTAEFLIQRRSFEQAGPVLGRARAAGVRDGRIPRYSALLPLLTDGDTARSRDLIRSLDPAARSEALGYGLVAVSRAMARVHAARADDFEWGETFATASRAVRAGADLSVAMAARYRGQGGQFDEVARNLEEVVSDSPSLAVDVRFLAKGALAVAWAGAGVKERADTVLAQLERELPDPVDHHLEGIVLFATVEAASLTGDLDRAASGLATLLSRPSQVTRALVSVDPLLRPLLEHSELSGSPLP